MTKSKGIIYSALVLLLITALIAAIIATVNGITKSVIAANAEEKVKETIGELFPDMIDFKELEDIEGLDALEGIGGIYKISQSNSATAYCVISTVNGYGGEIEIMTGFRANGNIVGVRILSASSETPGLGARIKEEGFLKGFYEKNYDTGAKVEGITGATISSTATVKGVNLACEAIKPVINGAEGGGEAE